MAANAKAPIDKGFAWLVLLACSFVRMLVDSFWSSLGIFYVEWRLRFDASVTNIAWIGVAFMLVLYVAGPLTSAISHKVTYKAVTIFSGLLASVSLFILSFATELWHIYLIIPFTGIGLGMAFQHGFTFFVYYFDKRYALAISLNGALGGLAYIIFPPFYETLNSVYGLRGTLQIISAIMLNICVCGMLMKQPTWEIHRLSMINNDILDQTEKLKNINNAGLNSGKILTVQNEKTNIPKRFFKTMSKSLQFSLFCNVRILVQGVLTPFMYGGVVFTIVYMVPSSIHKGVSPLRASLLISITGISAICARLSPIGCLVDRNLISASLLGGIACIFGGFSTMTFPFTTSYIQMVATSICFGVSMLGIAGSLYPVLIREAAGSSKKAAGALAYSNLVYGIGGVTGNMVTGFLYDVTNSYKPAYLLAGSLFFCMGITMLCDPYLTRWQARIDEKKYTKATLV